jgi:hypothetical protein
MANRFPLIVDSSALQIKELPASDNLDLANSSIVNVVDITASGNVSVGGVLTYEDVTNIDSVGIVTAQQGIKVLAGGINAVGVITATSFVGSGADLTALNASNLASGTIPDARFPSTLPAINGSQLTGVISGVETKEGGTSKGTSQVSLNFVGATVAAAGNETTVTISTAGLSTEAFVSSGIVTAVRLSTAQDHKITASGITTITTSGEGTEGESHTIRIINSGITTVGFSTYFLFPSGSTPSLPTADGAISLISFTVNRVGAGGTQLLAGASLNFS